MKRYLFLIALLIAWSGRVVAQSVTVDATIDSLQILIGEQAKIKLQVYSYLFRLGSLLSAAYGSDSG